MSSPPRGRRPHASDRELNPEQRAAVRHVGGPLLVVAGAGSGKTRVIAHKIAYLVREAGLAPHAIAAVTFTNKAAREMKARATALLGSERAQGLVVSTFHTLGLRIMQQEHRLLGLRRGFTIFDADDARQLVRERLRDDGRDTEAAVDTALARISAWKTALVTPEEALAGASDDVGLAAARLYAAYQQALRAYNAVDFDDLIALPVALLRADSEVRERWQNRLGYLLVDEYQDTNDAQYQLLRLLAGPRAAFTAVGDDDQSIYAWRGARPENLARLKQDYPTLTVIKLERNYRSTNRILRVANALIAHNPHVFEKTLLSELGEGAPVRVLGCADGGEEVARVVAEILALRQGAGAGWGDCAILYRSNHQSRPFEQALREQRIPYHLSGGTSFFERAEVRDLVAYLRLLVNPDDDSAFLRVVNVPRREIGPVTLEKLGAYAGARGVSLFEAVFELGLEQHLPERALLRLREFARLLVEIGDRAARGDPVAAVEELIAAIDYPVWLRDGARDPKAAEKKMANVAELVAWLKDAAAEAGDERATLGDLLARLSLVDLLDRTEEEKGGDAVHLMTLHAAKGLEFPHVFLVGLEEEVLPHRNSVEAENVAEERRLFYVGITRAQRTLTLTYAERRRRYGEEIDCTPSRFLAELPREDVEWLAAGRPASEAASVARGRATLATLRNLLAES